MFNTQETRTRMEGMTKGITSKNPLDINPQWNHEYSKTEFVWGRE